MKLSPDDTRSLAEYARSFAANIEEALRPPRLASFPPSATIRHADFWRRVEAACRAAAARDE